MKKASSSFLVLAFAALLVSLQSFAQRGEVINERVQQTLRSREIMRLSQILRVSPYEQMEILSLTVLAQAHQGQASLGLNQFGRPLAAPVRINRHLSRVVLNLPQRTLLEGLELDSWKDVYIESITAQVRRIQRPGPGRRPGPHQLPKPLPNQLITLQLHQQVHGIGQIPLQQLVKQQLGLSLQGAEIERIVVQGQPLRGGQASVEVVLNNRPVGQQVWLSAHQRQHPIRVATPEPVQSGLRLQVRGSAFIQSVMIRVGRVSGGHTELPRNRRTPVRPVIRDHRR